MATTQRLTTFAVWAPDRTDPGAPGRAAVRQPHLANMDRLIAEGVVRVGGGVFTSDSADAAPADRKPFGSLAVVEADSLEAARKIIESDLYYTSGVWDREKLQILPIALVHPPPPAPSE